MDSPFLGMVQYFAFDWAPKGYALCNGALLSISQNSALFALLGTFYGGNGTTNFALPDLRGRAVVGQSNSHTIGERFGTPTVTLLTSNMPMHTHTASGAIGCNNTNTGGTGTPNSNYPAGLAASGRGAGATMYTATADTNVFLGSTASPAVSVTIGMTGQGIPFNSQNPYLAITATIATVGLFPSRN